MLSSPRSVDKSAPKIEVGIRSLEKKVKFQNVNEILSRIAQCYPEHRKLVPDLR